MRGWHPHPGLVSQQQLRYCHIRRNKGIPSHGRRGTRTTIFHIPPKTSKCAAQSLQRRIYGNFQKSHLRFSLRCRRILSTFLTLNCSNSNGTISSRHNTERGLRSDSSKLVSSHLTTLSLSTQVRKGKESDSNKLAGSRTRIYKFASARNRLFPQICGISTSICKLKVKRKVIFDHSAVSRPPAIRNGSAARRAGPQTLKRQMPAGQRTRLPRRMSGSLRNGKPRSTLQTHYWTLRTTLIL